MRIVLVGAGLAAQRCAETLRQLGHDGPIAMYGDELPYDRPPLSKPFLQRRAAGGPAEARRLVPRPRRRLPPPARHPPRPPAVRQGADRHRRDAQDARRLPARAHPPHPRRRDRARRRAHHHPPSRDHRRRPDRPGGRVRGDRPRDPDHARRPRPQPVRRPHGPRRRPPPPQAARGERRRAAIGAAIRSAERRHDPRRGRRERPAGREHGPNVFHAGDVTGSAHWEAAVTSGQNAARRMLGLEPKPEQPPLVWSDQYGVRIQRVGDPAGATKIKRQAPSPTRGTAGWQRSCS